MEIISINKEHTQDKNNVAFNVDSEIDVGVLGELNMTDLEITKIDECVLFKGSGRSSSITELDISNFHSKYNAIKDHNDAIQKSLFDLIERSTGIPVGE